jgi:branched-chain amino acid transport system substrate-binding protein
MTHTRDRFSRYFFRVPPGSQQCNYEISKWWAQKGYKGKTFKNIIWIGADYAAPREHFQGYKKGLEEVGGRVVQELWPPLGTADLGPYLSAVKAGEADALVGAMWSEMATRLANQWVEYGLNKRITLIGVSTFCDEGSTLLGMGMNANGVLSAQVSCPQTDLPENKKFVAEFKKQYKVIPAAYAYLNYISAKSAYEAMVAIKGDVEDKEKFVDAIRKVNFISPMGYRAYFDEKHGMVHDFIMLETRKTNGEVHNFEIGRIKDVKDPYQAFP